MRRSPTRRKAQATKLLLRYTNVRGTLAWPEHDLRFRGTITITHYGTITITTRQFRLNKNTAWVLQQVPGKGRLATWAQLRATTNDGLRLDSDHVTMHGRSNHTGPRKATVALHGELSTLTVHHRTPPSTAGECTLIYHTIGMQGFQVQQATTTLGTIRLAGQTTIEDYDHLAGRIQITPAKNETRTTREWTSACDDELANILLIISLAEAKLIEWSIRQSATTDGTLFRTDFYGPKHTGTPHDIIFHWLNLHQSSTSQSRSTQEHSDKKPGSNSPSAYSSHSQDT